MKTITLTLTFEEATLLHQIAEEGIVGLTSDVLGQKGVDLATAMLGKIRAAVEPSAAPTVPAPVAIKPNEVMFNDLEYVRSTGHPPRGRGHWAFVSQEHSKRNDYLDFVFWADGRFVADACSAAAKHFAALGVPCVVVLP